ncbi:MAG TPA: hypothetical protein VFF31_14755 [Blastocatellia bacterium]|nr:hypothetical protein [Blastocatellia bacterium]
MTQESIKKQATMNTSATWRSRSCVVVALTLLLFLLTIIRASTTLSDGDQSTSVQRVSKANVDYGCPDQGGERTLRVLFYGLFFFSFPDGNPATPAMRNEARVGILSTRQDHLFALAVTEATCPADFPMLAFNHRSLQGQPETMTIRKNQSKGVTIRGCTDYIGWGEPADRDTTPEHGPYDFDWILDFEGRELHSRNLDQEAGRLRPTLVFRTGCFGAAELSERKFYAVNNGVVKKYGYVASIMEAVIGLNGSEQVTVQWGTQLITVPVCVTEIALFNMRPDHIEYILQNRRAAQPASMTGMHSTFSDHMDLYYDDLFKPAGLNGRFYFVPDLSPSTRKKRVLSEPFICYGGGGSTWP